MENKKEKINIKDEDQIKFAQLLIKLNIGRYSFLEDVRKIFLLSNGILIIHNNKMFLYDYIKYYKHYLMTIPKEYGNDIKLGRLRNNKFYMSTKNETFIYQFNDDFSIKLVNRINVNLNPLTEIEDNIYINSASDYLYIWKELKPIFKKNQLIFYILNTIFVLFLYLSLASLGKVIVYTIIILEYTTFIFAHRKFVYLLNPYKRLKIMFQPKIDKCGKNFCCISTINSQELLDYKNFTIKTIRLGGENQFISLWYRYIINDNIIIFTTFVDKKCKIYDVKQDKIINNFTIDFIITLIPGVIFYTIIIIGHLK